jgi:hypothetical protein
MNVSLLATTADQTQQQEKREKDVPKITGSSSSKRLLLRMTAKKLMVTAELMGIRKQHQDGTIRELTLADEENFERPPGATGKVDSILSDC